MKYLFLGIAVFIGLALVARVDIMNKKEAWSEAPIKYPKAPFQIYEDNQLFWKADGGIYYPKNQISPLSFDVLEAGLDSLSEYLKLHNEKMLLLKGSYTPDEQQSKVGQFTSLGVGRAYWMSEWMVDLGISRSRFILSDSLIQNNMINFIDLRIVAQ